MEDSGSRLPTRQDFTHLTDAHWAKLEKMVSLLGEAAFAGFPNLSTEQQRARVGRFDKYESSLIAHASAAAQEAARATMRAEAQSAVQASATNTASVAGLHIWSTSTLVQHALMADGPHAVWPPFIVRSNTIGRKQCVSAN
ncbi:unnamed protein product [Phytophthora fragariaefolia]|uniref:Unnamed protein product n=1 Tax=Phytophthora fragariaefolia TaxID=1490495 RepID=A0A9W7CZE3_9STRA|nr:unnamed protein product [Phytophthora fragariaefolia]